MEVIIDNQNIYLDQIINIWFWLFLICFIYLVYKIKFTDEISVKKALDMMKGNLIELMLFYNDNYNDGDKLGLVKKWIDLIDRDKIPKEQMDLFKEYIDGFIQKGVDE